MKTISTVVGLLMIVLGAIWVLQGVNLLPGSFMTGQIQWAVYGALLAGLGVVLLLVGRRRP